jgi:hypothetical protein
MPRIMVFGLSQRRTRKTAHIIRAFRDQGNETVWLNPAKIKRWKGDKANAYILERIKKFDPDIVFILSTHIPLPVLKEISGTRIRTVQYYHDGWRVELMPVMAQWGRLVDIFLSNAKGLHEQYRAVGIGNPVFITEGCDAYEHKKRRHILPIWESDVAFVGAARENELRISLIQKLNNICKVRIYGRFWKEFGMIPTLREVGPRGYGKVCSGAKIVLGIDAVSTIEGHWTNRLWMTLGCGGFHLTNYVPGMEEVFTNREHLVWYESEEECIDLVKEFLAKPKERQRIAEQGFRFVHEHHTFHHFADRVLFLVNLAEKPLIK